MTRPLRIEYPGAWYHVMNRGIEHREIFHDAQYYQMFLDLLAESHKRFQLEVHAYSLMSNHYHLLVRTPNSNLGRIMRHINGVFTQRYNRISKRDGPLFRGRYKAKLVEVDSYALQLSRYIHLNPVSAKMVDNPIEYLWSSYRYYLINENRPIWLYCNEILEYFTQYDSVNSYREYMLFEQDDQGKSFVLDFTSIPILGTDKFITRVNSERVALSSCKEVPEYRRLINKLSPEIKTIIDCVARYFKVPKENVISLNIKNVPKQIAIYLALQLSGKGIKEVSKAFCNISYSNVSQTRNRMVIKLKKDSNLAQHVENIKNILKISIMV